MYHNFLKLNLFKKFDKYVNFTKKQSSLERHFWRNMDSVDLHPPIEIRGMINLNRDAFRKQIDIPKLKIPEEILNKILPYVKTLLLKMENLKPIRTIISSNSEVECNGGGDDDDGICSKQQQNHIKEILLHPLAVQNWNDIPKDIYKFGVNESNFCYESIELQYDNWKADEILKSVLPNDKECLTSFSRIGHIIHVNLRDHLLPYKTLIGEVLKDKTVGCRTVVNKTNEIGNTYRNFNLELICGEPDYKVEVKEHGCIFEFDFSKVYWNPRLATEHERIVNLFKSNHDILYDVFAGVGPFSIPVAKKKKCEVLANDLNPESFKWLNVNAQRNKCTNLIRTFNKDGREFILEDLRNDLLKQWKSSVNRNYNIHITMNLPAIAIEFLGAFKNLFTKDDLEGIDINEISPLPLVHVYTFSKDENPKESIKANIENHLGGYKLNDNNLSGIYFVRNVAPNKDMYRVSFYLPKEILIKTDLDSLSSSSSSSTKKRTLSTSLDTNATECSDINHKKKCD